MTSRVEGFIFRNLPGVASVLRTGYAFWRHRAAKRHVRHLVKRGEDVCLELGAGDRKRQDGWITVDITRNCDLFWDLRKGLPFPDESVSKIYSSHLFEHLTYEEGQRLLTECRRALVPSGVFSICVPNAKFYIDAYSKGDRLNVDPGLLHKPAYHNTTKIDYVNYVAYMNGQHKYMFDEENLLHILASCGFRNARLRDFDPQLDLKERDFESIYAEAEK